MTPRKQPTPSVPELAIVSVIADRDDEFAFHIDQGEMDDYAALGMLFAGTISKLFECLPNLPFGIADDEDDEED